MGGGTKEMMDDKPLRILSLCGILACRSSMTTSESYNFFQGLANSHPTKKHSLHQSIWIGEKVPFEVETIALRRAAERGDTNEANPKPMMT